MQKRKLLFSVVYAAFVMNGALVSADLSTDTTDSSSTVEGNARRDNDIVLPVSNLKSESIDLSQQKVSAKNKLLLSLGVLMLVFGPGLIVFATPLAIAFGVFCCFIGIILSSIGGIGVRKDYALVSAVSKASVVTGKNACAGVYTDQTTPPAGGSMSPKMLQESGASVELVDSVKTDAAVDDHDTHEEPTDQTMPPAGGSPLQESGASVELVDSASKAVSEESQDTHEAPTDQTMPHVGRSMSPKMLQESDAPVKTDGSVTTDAAVDDHEQTQNGGDHSRRDCRIVRPIRPIMPSQTNRMAQPKSTDKNSSGSKSGVDNDTEENASGSKFGVDNDMYANASELKSGVDNDMDENASESKFGVDNDDDKNSSESKPSVDNYMDENASGSKPMAGDNVQAGEIVDHSATQIEEGPNAQELMSEIACALCEKLPSSEPAVGHSATKDEQSATEDEQKKLLNRLTKSNDPQEEKKAMAELINGLSQSTPKYKHLLQRVLNILRNPPQSASKDKNWLLNILRSPPYVFDHLCKTLRSILRINPSSRQTILSLAISNQDLGLVQGIVEALGQECLSVECHIQGENGQGKKGHVLELLCSHMYGRSSHQEKELISEKCILAYLLMNMDREKNVNLINSLIGLYGSKQQLDTEELYSSKQKSELQNAIYISKVLSIFKDETDHMGWIGMILAAVCEHLSTSSATNPAALATILKLLNKSEKQHIAYVEALYKKYAESKHNEDICKILNDFLSHNINSQSVTRPKKRNR